MAGFGPVSGGDESGRGANGTSTGRRGGGRSDECSSWRGKISVNISPGFARYPKHARWRGLDDSSNVTGNSGVDGFFNSLLSNVFV